MIYSDKQYTISNAALAKLRAALHTAERREVNQDWLKKAEIDALKSQIAEIEAEMAEYSMLKSGQITFSKSYALEALPGVLVQARIAAGLTQTDLGEKLGMKPQQIQRYEATNYMGASLARLVEVSRALGVKYSGTFESTRAAGASVFVWNDINDIVWSQLPYREMIKRGWFDVPRNANALERVKDYFLHAAGPQFATAYHRKKMRSGNVPNEYALIAWQARVLELARDEQEHSRLPEFELDDRWLAELVELTKSDDGPKQAKHLLAKHGIALVIEPHLPGSYLDGAAMLSDEERPIIGLTLRYDRLDNFWFVLFHELGHVFLHLFDGLRYDFFDEETTSDDDTLEAEADRFALNTLISEELWGQSLSRFALSEEAVQMDAEKLGIAQSIIAGRIRKERGNYTILKELVGQGRLRPQFAGASK
jgi:HTH-type transcriptional regulator/antitoxin HigA